MTGASWEYTTRYDGEPAFDRTARVWKAETRGAETKATVVHGEAPFAVPATVVADDSGVKLLRPNGSIWLLRYPLKSRAAWANVLSAGSSPERQERYSGGVARQTTVTTPAGRFAALEVWTMVDDEREVTSGTVWYAKGVGLVKSYSCSYELRSNKLIWEELTLLKSYHIPR